jgi:hypothetical protein
MLLDFFTCPLDVLTCAMRSATSTSRRDQNGSGEQGQQYASNHSFSWLFCLVELTAFMVSN